MQGGVHLLLGLLLCLIAPRQRSIGSQAMDLRLGFVLGTIAPDGDLPFAAIAVAVSGDISMIDVFHRTATHSFVITLIFIIAVELFAMRLQKLADRGSFSLLRNSSFRGHKLSIRTFTLGLCAGIVSHILLDMLYLKGVAVMWPVDFTTYGRSIFGHVEDLSHMAIEIWEATDHYTDVLFFFFPIMFTCYKKRLHLAWMKAAWIYCALKIFVATLFLYFAVEETFDYDTFFTLLYIPGTFFNLITVIAPIVFKDAVSRFGDL